MILENETTKVKVARQHPLIGDHKRAIIFAMTDAVSVINQERSLVQWRTIMTMTIMYIVIVILCLMIPSSYSLFEGGDKILAESEELKTTYGVIVDCGSSGTRANLYSWSNAIVYPALLNDIEPMRNNADNTALSIKKTPGLSSMKDEPEKSSDYMEKILKFITDNIPLRAQGATGVYIMATAGMRLLEKEIQKQIMDDIAKDISTKYNFAKVRTNVISGAQEGMYQWISVNSKAKRFAPALPDSDKKFDQPKTYAIIEMGGASIQVAYQIQPALGRKILAKLPKDTGAMPAFMDQIVEPSISQASDDDGYKYELHSTTFLGLGSNSARDNYLDMIIKPRMSLSERFVSFFKKPSNLWRLGRRKSPEPEQNKIPQHIVIKDPCMPKKSIEEKRKPIRMLAKNEPKTIGFIEEEGEEMFNVTVIGTGNYVQCRKRVSEFLELCKTEGLHCEPEQPCTMHLLGTPFVPFDSYEFLGLGEFYYTTSSMMKLDGSYRHDNIVEKSKEMCELSIDELEKKYPDANKFDKDRSRTECFKAVFVDTFLTEGLMMSPNFKNLETVGKIKNEAVDWTLGAVLDKSLTIEMATGNEHEDEDHLGHNDDYGELDDDDDEDDDDDDEDNHDGDDDDNHVDFDQFEAQDDQHAVNLHHETGATD